MELLPLIYLKQGRAAPPVGARPAWFQEDPAALAKSLEAQGAAALYLNDLNVPVTGRSENFSAIQAIRKSTNLQLWVTGNFRSITAIDPYAEAGVDKIVLSGSAYQDPALLKQASQKFFKKMAVIIEVKNKRVVIPGLVAPSHRSAADYAQRFEEDGVAALCYLDSSPQGLMTDDNLKAFKDFCVAAKAPVVVFSDIRKMQDLEKLFACEPSGLWGAVLGKPLYEGAFDLHSCIVFLNDLSVGTKQEKTITP